MADITMSIDDTLELDAVIKEWNDPNNIVSDDDNSFEISGFQKNTSVLNPQESGTHNITVNGQTLTVKVVDKGSISDVIKTENLVAWYRFEDGDARDYASESENSNVNWADPTSYDGTIKNSPTHKSSGGVTDFENGINSGAFEFSGAS